MKRDIYSCDTCDKVLSDDHLDIAIPHLSIVIGQNSGIATRGVCGTKHWTTGRRIPPGLYHFCLTADLSCLVDFIKDYVKHAGLEANMLSERKGC